MPDLAADPLILPEQPPMDDAAGGPRIDADAMPTEDKPEDGESAAHPS